MHNFLKKRPRNAAPILGERELMILEILWATPELNAQQILQRLPEEVSVSLNTVQSTIERLCRKGVLARSKLGRQFIYQTKLSKAAVIQQLLQGIADDFSLGDATPMISGFLGFLKNTQPFATDDQFKNQIQGILQELNDNAE